MQGAAQKLAACESCLSQTTTSIDLLMCLHKIRDRLVAQFCCLTREEVQEASVVATPGRLATGRWEAPTGMSSGNSICAACSRLASRALRRFAIVTRETFDIWRRASHR